MNRRTIYPYDHKLVQRARELRNHSTLGEILLWRQLKGKQMHGYDFHRQKPLFRYIVDFFCNELALAIEIDGMTHDEAKYDYDVRRQKQIEELGITVLRFTEQEVTRNLWGVLQAIEAWIDEYEKAQKKVETHS